VTIVGIEEQLLAYHRFLTSTQNYQQLLLLCDYILLKDSFLVTKSRIDSTCFAKLFCQNNATHKPEKTQGLLNSSPFLATARQLAQLIG